MHVSYSHNDGQWVQYSHVVSQRFKNREKDFSAELFTSKTVSPVVSQGGKRMEGVTCMKRKRYKNSLTLTTAFHVIFLSTVSRFVTQAVVTAH